MKIIFSPTKTMEHSSIAGSTIPKYNPRAKEIIESLKDLSDEELNKIWKVSAKLFSEAKANLLASDFNFTSAALFSYNGISFKYLDPKSLDEESLLYLNSHLRILSGLYGVLKPTDSIINYRLEMNYAKKIWLDQLSEDFKAEDYIINLASNEYSQMLTKYNIPVINIVFYKDRHGKLKEESTESKMMRGKFLRYLALNKVEDVNTLKTILLDDYSYNTDLSDSSNIIFVRKA